MPKQNSTTVAVETVTETLSNATLLDQIMAETKLVPTQEGYQVARQGVSAFIAEILKSHDPDQLINKHRVDQMIAELDRVLSKQMDTILHQPEFQQLESAWRSLKLLVDRTDFRENIKLDVLHVSKDDLLDDFENAADITCSGIYKHVYTAGYGQFGGEPVAAMVGNYSFGPSSPDIKLLSYMASVGAMAHAPFLAAPSPEFFNLSSFEELPNLKEIKDIFAGPRHAKWRAFRESEDSRHAGLTGPRFMLRSAYHPQEKMLFGELIDLAYEKMGAWFLVKKLGGLATRSVLKNIIGGVAGTTGVGLVVTAGMAAWTLTDVIDTATEVAEMLGPQGQEILADLMDLDNLQAKIEAKAAAYKKEPDKFLAEFMELQARRSPCISARKCMLVPYNNSKKPQVNKGEGCCPGQTGHHVIPDAAMKGNSCYSGKGGAPTICLEGTTQRHGSHGKAHERLEKILEDQGLANGDTTSYKTIRDSSIEAIQTAGAAHCSKKCLQAQLDNFYNACNKGDQKNISAHSGFPRGKPTGTSSGNADNTTE
ncbi:type VI secretion protein, EvpB/VC_A0108 family [Pseudomonas sp. LAIL14HWK12:I11]|nr:type VI secretion protein, EvpB/VC_A0108 family [Pseudomonas sp. LAIL14HWK12:I11]SMR73763.1 type VI secretion protein, EvpB/VC_A0108 family [Pseudomonas sp. LAIL14HWK12:I10]SOD06075.1 type VI secretion protein, EvpB/VC_A0108 family [Pseudomonas sp. LAIL14HWK12:I8]